MIGITSCFEIACAHHLPFHQGRCHRPHGHNYRIEFTCYGTPKTGEGSDAGMIVDFGDMDATIKTVLDRFDHYSLNDTLPNPTAELFALYLLDALPMIHRIVVWETGRHCAIAERDPLPKASTTV